LSFPVSLVDDDDVDDEIGLDARVVIMSWRLSGQLRTHKNRWLGWLGVAEGGEIYIFKCKLNKNSFTNFFRSELEESAPVQ